MASWSNQLMMERNSVLKDVPTYQPTIHHTPSDSQAMLLNEPVLSGRREKFRDRRENIKPNQKT